MKMWKCSVFWETLRQYICANIRNSCSGMKSGVSYNRKKMQKKMHNFVPTNPCMKASSQSHNEYDWQTALVFA